MAHHSESLDGEFYLFFFWKIFFMVIFIRIVGAIGSDVHWFFSRRTSLARNPSMQFCACRYCFGNYAQGSTIFFRLRWGRSWKCYGCWSGVAVAAKASRRRICFIFGIDFDLPYEVLGVDSSLSSCSSSSLAVCIPVTNVQENIVVPDLAPVVCSSSSAPKLGNVYNFHFN